MHPWEPPTDTATPSPPPPAGAWAPPPAGAWAPPPEPAPQRRRARVWFRIVLVLVLVVAIGGGAYWQFGHDHGASYPKNWDPRVASLVSFVEKTRGLTFKHPVKVEFLTEAQFKKRVSTSPDSLSKSDKQKLQDSLLFVRALGLVNGNVDLLAQINKTSTEGVLAYYDPAKKTMTIRGTALDAATRVTVVHEMTHALQDQHFDLQKLQHMDNDDESGAIQALVEGDATNVENAYVDSLSASDHRDYDKQSRAQDNGVDLKGVPPIIQISFEAPYAFGPPLVEVLRAEGKQAALDRAFVQPPADDEQVFEPTKFIRHDMPTTVAKPSLPAGAKEFDSGLFEPTDWFVMLTERIDPHVALRAADGWGGDHFVAYRTADNRVCQRTSYVGETTADTATMQRALEQWIRSLPVKMASVTRQGSRLLFESCDPGEKAKVATGKSLDAIALPVARVGLLQSTLHDGASLAAADCFANRVVDIASIADLNDPSGGAFATPAGRQRVAAIALACRNG